jgi:L-alanine-DL-glutamate epimerase-like enolase superfamily enzyme
MDLYAAISAVEQAMWDIQGKACEQPVYNLLGGRCRDRIRVYTNGWARGDSAEDIVQRATEMVERASQHSSLTPFQVRGVRISAERKRASPSSRWRQCARRSVRTSTF